MRARLIVFPVKGRNWCFSRSIEPLVSESGSGNTPSTLKDLWKKISFNSNSNPNVNPFAANAELVVDFVSNKVGSWRKSHIFFCCSIAALFLNGFSYIYLKIMILYVLFFLCRWTKLGLVWRRHLREPLKTSFMGNSWALIEFCLVS